MSRRRSRKKVDPTPKLIDIDSMAHDGRGVGRDENGKVVFVDYALPTERVEYQEVMHRQSHLFGTTLNVIDPSEHRVEPRCGVFGACGGCVLQPLDPAKQLEYKHPNPCYPLWSETTGAIVAGRGWALNLYPKRAA